MSFSTSFTVLGVCPKPRQTRKDKWSPSESVLRYRTWADLARIACNGDPMQKVSGDFFGILVIAHIALPQSWSQRKKDQHSGMIHQQRPDSSNILKAAEDALFEKDENLACTNCIKLWCEDQEESRCDIFLLWLASPLHS